MQYRQRKMENLKINKNQKFYFFHVGRGGQFYNAGFKKFVDTVDAAKIEFKSELSFIERDGSGKFYNMFVDNVGSSIISLKDFKDGIKKGRVIIEFDGNYDTDIYTTEEMMTEEERELFLNLL